MITSPSYSFIQFNQAGPDGCCQGISDIALPVFNNNDLFFQVIADVAPTTLDVVDLDGNVISSQSGFVSAGPGSDYYLWQSPIDISALPCDACFQLKIGTALSNVFKKVCDDCYTTIIEYYNDEDYAEFLYCNLSFVNRVRLPFYLLKPQFPEEKTVYRKSNGAIRLTKSLISKEYEAETEFMTEGMHQSLMVALGHDNKNVFSSKYTGGISKSGDYAIDWPDGMCVAPAAFKVLSTPFAIRNNNCQECADPCVAVIVPSFSLPDANSGSSYNQTITLGGTAPFTLSNIVKPSWMTISVSGNTLTFSGTPSDPDAGTGITVSFDITNACGNDSGSSTIDVIAVPCVAVGISGSPSLPDAESNTPYTYSFSLTGDAPFTLSAVSKPSWMTIAVTGSTVYFSGTPDPSDEGSNIDISFTINNCASDTIDFSDTIDTLPGGARFTTPTSVSGDNADVVEIANILGTPGSTVTITMDASPYVTTNGGTILVNGSPAFPGNIWTVLLDGSGQGTLDVAINGVYPNPGTAMLGHFTITAVDSGAIGSPDTYQISKAY